MVATARIWGVWYRPAGTTELGGHDQELSNSKTWPLFRQHIPLSRHSKHFFVHSFVQTCSIIQYVFCLCVCVRVSVYSPIYI